MANRRSNKTRDRAAAAHDIALERGLELLHHHDPGTAERIAREVLAQRPGYQNALHLLGRALLMQSRAPEAVAPLEQAARDCTDPIVETHYALALRDVGRTADALHWLQRATSRKPIFAGAYHELGVVLCAMRQYDKAEAALKTAVDAQPSVAEHSVELGGVYICRADPGQAKIAFARALANAPGHVRALHGFGTALLFEGELERAAERFRQVLVHTPTHTRACLDLAHCMLELGRFAEGVKILRTLVSQAPQHYGKALKLLVSSAHGRFWLRPSAAAVALGLDAAIDLITSSLPPL